MITIIIIDNHYYYYYYLMIQNLKIRSLISHIKKQPVSLGLGGMKLLRDMTEYSEFGAKLESKIARSKFELLKNIANIHIVPANQLSAYINDASAPLSLADKNDLLSFVPLRSDQLRSNVEQPESSNYFNFQFQSINRRLFSFY
jgi:hypothetical protein